MADVPHLRVAGDPVLAPSVPGVERSISVADAAELMGADESTVRKLLNDEELQGYRLGKRGVRVYVSSIRDYQARQRLGKRDAASKTACSRKVPATPAHREAVATLAALGIIRTASPR